jgi:putative SOS response-associated peptidase YedK
MMSKKIWLNYLILKFGCPSDQNRIIFTTLSIPLMDKIHNLKKRMPLILSPSDEIKWIDPSLKIEQIIELIKPYPENDMTAYTISRAANNARNNRNVPEILNRVEYPELDLVS